MASPTVGKRERCWSQIIYYIFTDRDAVIAYPRRHKEELGSHPQSRGTTSVNQFEAENVCLTREKPAVKRVKGRRGE